MVEVLHKVDPDFMEGRDGLYILVAVVDTDNLDVAYEKTNHIHYDWQENDEILRSWAEEERLGNRSTSIGDLMVRDGQIHEVAFCGFNEIQ